MRLVRSRCLALTALVVIYKWSSILGLAALAGGFGFVFAHSDQASSSDA
jgi:hypothetical protein